MTDLEKEFLGKIKDSSSLEELEALRVHLVGKNGVITEKLKGLAALTGDARKEQGAILNALKSNLMGSLESKQEKMQEEALEKKLLLETLDISLPGRSSSSGRIHPISKTISQVTHIFGNMGFKLSQGPDVEDDFHNFSALNIGAMHPARQEQDTFYLENEDLLLRTQTSNVQIREMMKNKPPFRLIAPGRVFRSDYDQTHTPMFHQVEGLVIEPGIHMGHLRGCLMDFLKSFFEVSEVKLRFRPSYFPFTEPSAEVDIQCDRSGGKLKIGQGEDWLEILGCGMVHPQVLRNCNIDPGTHQGFAFGMGIERITMLKHAIPDLRTFFESDLKWMNHYGFSSFA